MQKLTFESIFTLEDLQEIKKLSLNFIYKQKIRKLHYKNWKRYSNAPRIWNVNHANGQPVLTDNFCRYNGVL